MLLYHYSNEDNLKTIDPDKFCANSHTPVNSEQPRSYYYLNKTDREKFFLGAKYRYTIVTPNNRIYDCLFDVNGLFARYDLDTIISLLKKKGFIGLRFRQISGRDAIALFYSQKIIQKEVL
jgi:hypothetical protein